MKERKIEDLPELKIRLKSTETRARLLGMGLALRSARLLLVKHREIFHRRPRRVAIIDYVIHQIDVALGDDI